MPSREKETKQQQGNGRVSEKDSLSWRWILQSQLPAHSLLTRKELPNQDFSKLLNHKFTRRIKFCFKPLGLGTDFYTEIENENKMVT